MVTKIKAGNVENLEIFLGHNGDVIGVCFTKDDCEYSFDEATLFDEEEFIKIAEHGRAMVAY